MNCSRLALPAEDGPKVRLIRLRNRLREKATGGGGANRPMQIDPAALEAAEAAFGAERAAFPEALAEQLDELRYLARQLETESRAPRAMLSRLQFAAHDLRGQGGTFGFPLITAIAKSLHACAAPSERLAPNQIAILRAHIDAMQAVMAQRIQGDGGPLGRDLLDALQAAISRSVC